MNINNKWNEKTVFLSVITLVMMSCNSNKLNKKANELTSETMKEEIKAMGGEKDKHGCLSSAGEIWSELRKKCLQIFNEGIRLSPVKIKEGNAVISAFVLFNEDKTKAELFLPTDTPNVILEKSEGNLYQKDNYQYDVASEILKIDGKDAYKAEKEDSEVLVIFYDVEIGKKPLLKAIEDYGAKINYQYNSIKGIAISVPKDKINDAISYFEKVKGVLAVNKNEKSELHK